MKNIKYQQIALKALLVCCLLLSFSQSAYAAKKSPPNQTTTQTIIIDSVTIDDLNNTIVITGSGLQAANNVTLGGVDVQSAISPVNDNQLNLNFNASTATAVSGPGSYSLVVDGKEFPVYFSSAIVDPFLPVVCPCETEWAIFGASPSPDGFAGLTPTCTFLSAPDEDQASVQFIDYPQIWILTSEYNNNAKQCALVIDAPTRPLNSIQEHEACVQYLNDLYITPNPGVPSCL